MQPSIIFDFDGVLGDTFEAFAEFLVKKARYSPDKARRILVENGMNNNNLNVVYKFAQGIYFRMLKKFLSNHSQLLFEERLKEIQQIKSPKAILTRSDAGICKSILGDYASEFELILGRKEVSSKTKGLQKIFKHPQFTIENTVFVTDTVGDLLEVSQVMPKNQIYAVTWGFHSLDILDDYISSDQVLSDFKKFID